MIAIRVEERGEIHYEEILPFWYSLFFPVHCETLIILCQRCKWKVTRAEETCVSKYNQRHVFLFFL